MNNLKCLVKNKKYILIYLSLDISESLHANIILIDTHQKTIERFDPYGNINANDEIDIVLKDYFSYLTYFKYLKPSDYMKTSSFQTLSNEGIKRKQGDILGYCVAWCFWYIELRINNSKIKQSELIIKTIKKLINQKILFIDFIRNYAQHLDDYFKKIKLSIGIDKKNIYNIENSYEDQEKIKSKIFELLSKYK